MSRRYTRALVVSAFLVFAVALIRWSPVAWSQASVSSAFDHFTTGFRLDGAHQFAECSSCHVDGLFEGTPTHCGGCHTQASRIRATAQPTQHVSTTEFCESCHRTNVWVPVARVDHLETQGTCASCHDNRDAMGKPVDHIPTSDQCDDCHRSVAWAPAAFSHTGITSGCFSCHNGMTATGKPVNHIPATNLCEDCHNTVMFSPVARVDHLQVLGVCSSCHNGTIARGQFVGHIPTTAECDTCHNTTSFRP
jgi:predicted CXXCH cytochrome family protein